MPRADKPWSYSFMRAGRRREHGHAFGKVADLSPEGRACRL